MDNANKQIPKEVTAAISTIIKFLEETEKDFIEKNGHHKEDNHENS